jgi:hypothetical protein
MVKTTSLQKRIAKLEAEAQSKLGANASSTGGLWVDGGDGILRHRDGRSMTREAFEAAFPDAKTIRLKIFDKELSDRRQRGGENASCGTERPRK